MLPVKRSDIRLKANPSKVILKYLNFGSYERIAPVWEFVEKLSEKEAERQLTQLYNSFEHRHFDLNAAFKENYVKALSFIKQDLKSETHKLLLGAYFTHEYSIQSAALFNPSIVAHPDQNGLPDGSLRFVMSLRATGEGHISSITFKTGVLDKNGNAIFDPEESKLSCGYTTTQAGDYDYEVVFNDDIPLSSRVLFPFVPSESNGMEDARFVLCDEDGKNIYRATYTAYNGHKIQPRLVETENFKTFTIRALSGKAATDKGFALFSEKIDGKYVMIGRQGGRSMSIMYSEDLYHWDNYKELQVPQRSWEILQLGNCGSPVKTKYGWLLLTHAVGPMRKYVISATLLDIQNPALVIASLEDPLMIPNEEEREGYVPNVLYTCGMLLHEDQLIIPYAMSDSAISFVTVELDTLVEKLMNQNIK